jgi:hypothetical protein
MQKLQVKPENVYNMDEKGFVLGQALKCKVIVRAGRKNPRYVQDGNREMVTVIECVSADGRVLPPMYIYKGSAHLLGMQVLWAMKRLPLRHR